MKAAIYSRGIETGQLSDLQIFFDELNELKIEPIIFLHLFEQLKETIQLPSATTTFSLSEQLKDDIECIISLGGDG